MRVDCHRPQILMTIDASEMITIATPTNASSRLGSVGSHGSQRKTCGEIGRAASTLSNTNFVAGDTITVNGTPITFVASGATGNQLNVTDNIQTLLAKIDSITGAGTASAITGGAITLHTGTASDLTITSSNTAALGALGFTAPTTQARGGGGTPGAGVVVGNDLQAFLDESISGGAGVTGRH